MEEFGGSLNGRTFSHWIWTYMAQVVQNKAEKETDDPRLWALWCYRVKKAGESHKFFVGEIIT